MSDVRQWDNGSYIRADKVQIGWDFRIGRNVFIDVRGVVKIGNYCRFGNDVQVDAEHLEIGDHFYHHTSGLRVGGGGSGSKYSILVIGNRCVFHNNYINLARSVSIGNDVGLCPDVDILTHGFWNSVLDGFPTTYLPVVIGNGVLVGQRSFINPGVNIADDVVIGANSTVTKSIWIEQSVWAGNPARYIRTITEPSMEESEKKIREIVNLFPNATYSSPWIFCNGAMINPYDQKIMGVEDQDTDDLRDHLRRYGIKIYTSRPFGNFQC